MLGINTQVQVNLNYIKVAEEFNDESIMAITNVVTDVATLLTWTYLAISWPP